MELYTDAGKERRSQLLQDNVPWLGFDHDLTRKSEFQEFDLNRYPLQHGWTKEQIENLKRGIPLEHYFIDGNRLAASESGIAATLAMLQSWMSFGLLETA